MTPQNHFAIGETVLLRDHSVLCKHVENYNRIILNAPPYLELCSHVVVPQIRKGKRDNLGIIFQITPVKHIL